MNTTKTWTGYYHTKMNGFLIIIINIFIIAPLMALPGWLLGREVQKQHSELVMLAAFVIAIVSVWAMLKIFYTKHKASLTYLSKVLQLRKISMALEGAKLIFGRYGTPGSGSQGSILHINNNENQHLKIAILNYTIEDPNLYTADWTTNADFYVDEKTFKDFYSFLQTQKLEVVKINEFKASEIIFELRGSMSIGKFLLNFYLQVAILCGIIFISDFLISIFFKGISHDIILGIIIFSSIAFGFYYLIIKWNRGRGFFMVIQHNIVHFLELKTKKEIFSIPVSNVIFNIYLARYLSKYGFLRYQELKLKVPRFKKITIGTPKTNLELDKPLKKKVILFGTNPNYIVDYNTWQKIVDIFQN